MPRAASDDNHADILRHAEVDRFVKARYGIRGTFALHRAAFGLDLLRAPVNVALAPIFLLIKLIATLLSSVGAKRAGAWLARRHIFLKSDMARRIETDLHGFITQLHAQGLVQAISPKVIDTRIAGHAETRNAVSEITTSLLVLIAGLILLDRATPGIISLAGPIAEIRAHSSAVNDFLLGQGMGRMWYSAFPVEMTPAQVILTGVVLAVIGSVVTAFAGLIADPVQVLTGTHRRRLLKLLNRLDQEDVSSGLEREHLLARFGDLFDILLGIWRSLRN